MAKDVLYLYAGNCDHSDLLFSSHYKKIFHPNEIEQWVIREKEHLTFALKYLLSCLRSVRQARVQRKQKELFVEKLSILLALCETPSIIAIPIILFRAKLEAIAADESNIATDLIANELFSLKNNLQKLFRFISSITEEEMNSDAETMRY